MPFARRSLPWFLLACLPAFAVAQAPAAVATARAVHGRVEQHAGVKLLRVWGTPAERGYAHGFLLAQDIAAVAIAEFTARFARKAPLLRQARDAVKRTIGYPDDVRAEIEAMYEGLVAAKVDLDMPELERAFDLQDLLVANALDVFGLMGCSGFTLWGDQVVGGGVLTARNFDWPYTGPHLLEHTMLVVQHFADGRAVASVAWPGYVGTVTGVSSDGVAVFLHVGSARISMTPESDSWPTAVAARAILQLVPRGDAEAAFSKAKDLLSYTSPPAGYLTRVVLPQCPTDGAPVAVFETDVRQCVRESVSGASVVTNHFTSRQDGRPASKDSLDRATRLHAGLDQCCGTGDKQVSIEEAWQILESVQRGNSRFGTLHSLVFRQAPWCFDLRIATVADGKILAAPVSARRCELTRQQLFATGEVLGQQAGK
ncbi:MAG TPA: C45 family peptidase [Planctomycetota bacterium]|nr:C45 family peptidase [Planctomycetota bacterium]